MAVLQANSALLCIHLALVLTFLAEVLALGFALAFRLAFSSSFVATAFAFSTSSALATNAHSTIVPPAFALVLCLPLVLAFAFVFNAINPPLVVVHSDPNLNCPAKISAQSQASKICRLYRIPV